MQTKRKLFLSGFLDMLVFEETRLLIELQKKLLTKKPTADLMPFSDLKPLTAKYIYQVWQKEWDETGLVSNIFHKILPKLPDKLLSFCNTRKKYTVLDRLHIGHSYLTHSFILRKEETPVCVACKTVITVKHILTECADLLMKLVWYLISFMKFYQNFQTNCYPFVTQEKKTPF